MKCPAWSRDSSPALVPAAHPEAHPASPINVLVPGQAMAHALPIALTAPTEIGTIAAAVRLAPAGAIHGVIHGVLAGVIAAEIPGAVRSGTAALPVRISEASKSIHSASGRIVPEKGTMRPFFLFRMAKDGWVERSATIETDTMIVYSLRSHLSKHHVRRKDPGNPGTSAIPVGCA